MPVMPAKVQALFVLSGLSITMHRTGSSGLSGLVTASFGVNRLAFGTVASRVLRLLLPDFTNGAAETWPIYELYTRSEVLSTALDNFNKQAVDSRIVRKLWMERGCQHIALPHRYGSAVIQVGQHLDARSRFIYAGGAYENAVKWRAVYLIELDIRLEAVYLPPECVAANLDVHQVEGFGAVVSESVGDNNHSGARTPDRQAALDLLLEYVPKVVDVDKLGDGGAFTAGDNEAVDVIQLVGEAYLRHLHPQFFQHLSVFLEVSLYRQNADCRQITSPG